MVLEFVEEALLCETCGQLLPPKKPRYVIATQAEIDSAAIERATYVRLSDAYYSHATEGEFIVRLSDFCRLAVFRDGAWLTLFDTAVR